MDNEIYRVDQNIKVTDDVQEILKHIVNLIFGEKPENVEINVKIKHEIK